MGKDLVREFKDGVLVNEYEVDTPAILPLCSHFGKILALNAGQERPLSVQIIHKGDAFNRDCYVTQDLVEQYQSEKLKVGDYVRVDFLENAPDRPLASQKIYKTW